VHWKEVVMPKGEYEIFEALNPFFEVVTQGLRELVDGDHYSTRLPKTHFSSSDITFPVGL
jgi:hypothetical protein